MSNEKWQVVFSCINAEKEVEKFSSKMLAKLFHVVELIEIFGLQNVGLPHIKPLDHGLWEIRIKDKDNIGRSIFVAEKKKAIVILHSFIKKDQKTPNRNMTKALKRLEDYKNES